MRLMFLKATNWISGSADNRVTITRKGTHNKLLLLQGAKYFTKRGSQFLGKRCQVGGVIRNHFHELHQNLRKKDMYNITMVITGEKLLCVCVCVCVCVKLDMTVNWKSGADLDSRENDSCIGMGETWSDSLTDALGLTIIFGLWGINSHVFFPHSGKVIWNEHAMSH